jgi:uncharacterized membrane protein YjgN (DUF898 family)
MDQTVGSLGDGPQQSARPLRLSWVPPSGLLGLSFANFLFRILTLGIYNFWAKTEIRRRIWSAVRLDGEPLAYTGTGKELFLGFLLVLGIVFLPTTLISIAVIYFFGPQSPAVPLYQLVLYLFFFFLTGVAIYRAQRYRLSRTNWRGIRGSLVGSDRAYSWLYCWTAMLIPMTLGWIMPWRSTALQEVLTKDTRFGDRPFHFKADAGPLYAPFAVFWVGAAIIIIGAALVMTGAIAGLTGLAELTPVDPNAPPDIGKLVAVMAIIYGVLAIAFLLYYLLSAWYRARQINHFANHTQFEGARFRSTVSGGGLIWIAIGNFLLRMAGFLIGVVLLGIVFGIAGAMTGGDTATSLTAQTPGEPPGILVQFGIFGSIIVLAASAGLFSPIIQARSSRYLIENLSIDGHVPLADIAQGVDQGIKRGEGLAQAFDVDAF